MHLQNEAANLPCMMTPSRSGMMGLAAAALFKILSISVPAQAQPVSLPPGLEQMSKIMSGEIGQKPEDAGKPVVTIIETPPHFQDEATYRFLGGQFLQAAQKANVLTLGNELPLALRADLAKLENVAAAGDQATLVNGRNIVAGEIASAPRFDMDAAGARRTADAIVDYAIKAAKLNIEVAARDPAFSDPVIAALGQKVAADNKLYASTTDAAKRAALKAQVDEIGDRIAARRATPEVNQPMVDALIAEQNGPAKGNMAVIVAPDHGPIMQQMFHQAGYATAKISLHVSADGLAQDLQVAQKYKVDYFPQNRFLMDTMTFADAPQAAPAAKWAPSRGP